MKPSILVSFGLSGLCIFATISVLQNHGFIYALPLLILSAGFTVLFSGVMDYHKK
jgi:hypothetical protein